MTQQQTLTPYRTVVTSFVPSSSSYEDGNYILHIACGPNPNSISALSASTTSSQTPLTCALSNRCIQTYDRETLQKVHIIENAHDKRITDLVHAPIASSGDCVQSPLIVSSSEDGFVKIFDLRVKSSLPAIRLGLAAISKEEAQSVCVGYSGALAAVGGSKGQIHFFDLRHVSNGQSGSNSSHVQQPLGSYVDSHTDEVTKVRFQQMNSRDSHETTQLLVSASEDGLCCTFDTSQPSEEMALTSVMNVGSPLRDVGFFGPSMEGMFCLTGSETMSVWHHDSAQRIGDFGDVRNYLSSLVDGMPIHYLVGCAWMDEELNLLAGNTEGEIALYKVDAGAISLKRRLTGGHKGCIRSFVAVHSRCQQGVTSIFTAGEDSRICEWDPTLNCSGVHDDSADGTLDGNMSCNRGTSVWKPGRNEDSMAEPASLGPREGGGAIRRKKKKDRQAPY